MIDRNKHSGIFIRLIREGKTENVDYVQMTQLELEELWKRELSEGSDHVDIARWFKAVIDAIYVEETV